MSTVSTLCRAGPGALRRVSARRLGGRARSPGSWPSKSCSPSARVSYFAWRATSYPALTALAIVARLRTIRARNAALPPARFQTDAIGPLHVDRAQPPKRRAARGSARAMPIATSLASRLPIADRPLSHYRWPDSTSFIADYPITDRTLSIARLPITHCRLPDSPLPIVDCPLSIAYRIADCRSALPIADVFAIADSPIADCRLLASPDPGR